MLPDLQEKSQANDNNNNAKNKNNIANAGDNSQNGGDFVRIESYSIAAPNSVETKYARGDHNSWIQYNLEENESDAPGVFEKREKIKQTFIKAYNDYDRVWYIILLFLYIVYIVLLVV